MQKMRYRGDKNLNIDEVYEVSISNINGTRIKYQPDGLLVDINHFDIVMYDMGIEGSIDTLMFNGYIVGEMTPTIITGNPPIKKTISQLTSMYYMGYNPVLVWLYIKITRPSAIFAVIPSKAPKFEGVLIHDPNKLSPDEDNILSRVLKDFKGATRITFSDIKESFNVHSGILIDEENERLLWAPRH